MGDDAIMREPKKSGCLKWTCGCLVVFLVVGAVGGIFIWRWLGSWDPNRSAWEHMPPETLWAVEVHDTKAIFESVVDEPGFASLLRILMDNVAGYVGEDIDFSPRGHRDPHRELADVRKSLGPWFRILVPNSAVIGSISHDELGVFLICMPPAFIRWAVEMPSNEYSIEERRDGATSFFYAAVDGWMVVAPERDTVQVVLDGWETGARPLGPAMGRAEPYLLVAGRLGDDSAGTVDAEEPADASPGHFTLADPFAAASAAAVKPEADEPFLDKPLIRLVLSPTEGGWSIWSDVGDAREADGLSPVVTAVDRALGAGAPSLSVAELADCELSLRIAPELFANWRQKLADATSVDPDTAHPNRVLLSRWLNQAWLNNASGDFSVLASAPDATVGRDEKPLPRLAAGWAIRNDVPPERAGEELTNALSLWLDSLTAPGGSPLLQNLKGTISYTVNRHGSTPAGEISLPPAVADGVKPSWRFNTAVGKAMGWMASDPGVIPNEKRQGTLSMPELPAPGRDRFVLAGGWHFSRGFIGALFDALEERLPPLLADGDDFDEDDILLFLSAGKQVMTAFPRGGMRVECDTEQRRVNCKVFIPCGERTTGR